MDLPGDRTLFALLRGADGAAGDAAIYQARLISDALRAGTVANAPIAVDGLDLMAVRKEAKDAEVRLDLPPKLYPLLVTFTDVADPKSVERVAPANLVAAFGSGYALRRITVEVTDDALTTGIRKRLATLGLEPDRGLDRSRGVTANPTLAQQLSYGDFVKP